MSAAWSAVDGSFVLRGMFGVSVWFGVTASYPGSSRVSARPGVPSVPYHRPVTPPLSVDRATARRFMARRHLLAPPRALPAERDSVMRVMDRLGSFQFDPLDIAGRNHDLLLNARIGEFRREWTDELLYE